MITWVQNNIKINKKKCRALKKIQPKYVKKQKDSY